MSNSLSAVDGFCNFERQITDHGNYNWNETKVTLNNTLDCEFGPTKDVPNGKARRKCLAPRMWAEYYGEECITRVTHEVELLGKVSKYLSLP